MEPAEQRAALTGLAKERGVSLAELSRLLGRNGAYLQQYLARGSPRLLPEGDRARLARYFGVVEALLGGPEPDGLVEVRRLDIGASAGPGGMVDREAARAAALFSPAQLKRMGVRAAAASMIRVAGDSMAPTLEDGDEVLVDHDSRIVAGKGAIFVARIDGVLMVKRLRSAVGGIEIVSDNPAYPPRVIRGDALDVIGRVAWLGRTL